MKALPVLLTLIWLVTPTQARYGGGTGEPNDPHQIATAEDLILLGDSPEDYDKHFIVTADIDLDPNLPGRKVFDRALIAPDIDDLEDWFQGTAFTGTFHGGGFTIRNLTIAGHWYIGLFGALQNGARVRRLGIVDANIVATGQCAGIIAGSNRGQITECFSIGIVRGYDVTGGLIGTNEGFVHGSYSTGEVHGDMLIGGLVGFNGGSLYNSYSMSNVSGNETIGGLVGNNHTAIITNCYSIGKVTGNRFVGGLTGHGVRDKILVNNSFWDTETSGQATSARGTGKTTFEMQTASTFSEAGWDFMKERRDGHQDIWWILEDESYPRLWWQYGLAFLPHPQDSATYVAQPLILSWLPGGLGLWHDIYFGEDKEAVANATTESAGIYRGRQAPKITIYDPGLLELDKTYYWRVDELDSQGSTMRGPLWSLTTADFFVVDDFESYNDDDNRIWNTWVDGFGDPNNGSIVGDLFPWYWHVIVHSGQQSMPFYYDNSLSINYSEATAHTAFFAIGHDWTIGDVTTLSLWFRGSHDNGPELMYVALANANGPSAIVYHEDPNAALIDIWAEWRIPLEQFSSQGVDLTRVTWISIGFGDKNIPPSNNSGQMYFDDIRLYRPQSPMLCDSEVNGP